MELVTFYSSNLAVPQRRDVGSPDVLKGKATFYALGCASCHVPKFVTSRQASDPAQAFQLIWPYSDSCSMIWAKDLLIVKSSARRLAKSGVPRTVGHWTDANRE